MTASIELILARAMTDLRAGKRSALQLDRALRPSQAGAALRLARDGAIALAGPALAEVNSFQPLIDHIFREGPASALLGGGDLAPADLEIAVGPWFDEGASPLDLACAGFWLGDLFLRGVGADLSYAITAFLLGKHSTVRTPAIVPSVRRYPTGGISEKQALLLPPLLRALARPMAWVSPFLVARKLAHTGGTADKLATLPGFDTVSRERLTSWSISRAPVYYLAAGQDLCPRDSIMYRLRGETGTVADPGLMAASIMSKQIAAPADVILLDVLYGGTAFLPDRSSADAFGVSCVTIGERYGIRVEPIVRSANGVLGRSVGATTEILEAISIMRGDASYTLALAERERSLNFIAKIASALNRPPEEAVRLANIAIDSGQAFDELLSLWRDHGVEHEFLAAVRDDPRKALLSGVKRCEIRAIQDAELSFDPVALSDAVYAEVNGELSQSHGAPGGLELFFDQGDRVARGQLIANMFGSRMAEGASAVAKVFELPRR